MIELSKPEKILIVSKALASDLRLNIIRLLGQNKKMNINELSEKLHVTNGAMTSHIKLLYDAGIIGIEHSSGKRGSQKVCYLMENKFLFDLMDERTCGESYYAEIPVGSYSNFEVYPTCGLSTVKSLIGEVDDTRYFNDPKRIEASVLWFGRGFIEYRIPNYIKPSQTPLEFQVSLEIASEAPGYCEDWPSDIYFEINSRSLGYWTSPGDFGKVRGMYTPEWFPNWNQYGLLKLLVVNREGSFVDGFKISDTTIDDLDIGYNSDIIFRISNPENANNVGGVTIFGKGFGNYSQDIHTRMTVC